VKAIGILKNAGIDVSQVEGYFDCLKMWFKVVPHGIEPELSLGGEERALKTPLLI